MVGMASNSAGSCPEQRVRLAERGEMTVAQASAWTQQKECASRCSGGSAGNYQIAAQRLVRCAKGGAKLRSCSGQRRRH